MALKRLQEVDVDGIGVVFNDDFTGVDLDNAIDDSGAIKPWAAEILKECPTYTEKSPSGTGLHLITAGSLQKGWKGTKRAYHDGAVEIYSRGRFFTMTGDSLNGHDGDLHDYSPMIRELYKRIGGPVPTNGNGRRRPQSEPVLDVSERLEVALREPVFYRLWHGDTSGNHDDDSAADLALCNKLVFYFGKNFWISIVARVYCPGCQVDNMIVLEGPQGLKKSSALRVIGGNWFCEQHEAVNGRAFFEVLQGKLLVEISELDAFSRADVTRVKQVVTCVSDRYREPYGHHAKDHPRQCVFVGSTNKDDWNRDETGARRFWPIRCTEIDIDAIASNREQFFAEAVHRFKSKETWWEMPSIETEGEQESRYVEPAWSNLSAGTSKTSESLTITRHGGLSARNP